MNGIILTVALTTFLAVAGYFFLNYTLTENSEDKKFLSLNMNKPVLIMAAAYFVVSIGMGLFETLYTGTVLLSILSHLMLFGILFFAGVVDLKKSIIPNSLIVAGLVMYVVFALFSIFVAEVNVKGFFLLTLGGGFIIGILLLLVLLISKNSLGMGDVKLFFVVGILLGLKNTYYVLLITVIIMALVSIILLILKKVTRKTAVPMAPFMAIGFLICVFLGMK